MNRKEFFPNQDRFSVVIATILLAYTIAQFIDIPPTNSSLSIGGLIIPYGLNYSTLVTFAVAGLTASGTDWILRDHPTLEKRSTVPHLLLPSLSAWILNIVLNSMEESPYRWAILVVGGIFLFAVILAEFNAIYPEDYRRPVSSALLSAISYAMILAMTVSLEASNQRLILALPAVALGTFILSMRILQLNLPEQWPLLASAGCTLVTVQLATALHYLPVTPLSFGLILLGALYALINLVINLSQDVPLNRAGLEATISVLIIWLVAIWIN